MAFPLQVRLKCSAEGSPRPDIAWFKDGLPLEARPAKHNAFTYKISKLSPPHDVGNYTCVVTNPYGEIRDDELIHQVGQESDLI